jgi:hypothetical protein
MRTSRRLFAIVAALAVAFGALWPLVSAARPANREIPNFICTQSGFQHPGTPSDADDHFHCPLCVFSMDAALPQLPPGVASCPPGEAPGAASFIASPQRIFLARPPPSRAPPSDS